jgi:uncharacterized membrane protein YbhN (UPF0104 family)
VAIAAAGTVVVIVALLELGSSLPPIGQISHPNPLWVAAALLAELGALVAYALIVREVLKAWGVRGRTRALLRATVGGIAIGATLPAGQAVSTAYWYRQLRREGAEPRLAAFALGAAAIAGALSLTMLLVVGVAVAGSRGPLASVRVPVVCGAAVVLVLRVVFRRQIVEVARKLGRRWSLTPPLAGSYCRRTLVAIATFAYINWLLDCVSLVAALAAVHAGVPAESVLLTYALAQLVNQLPLLPGGGGTVELSLSLGFAAFGNTSGEVLAGVLLFRLITCWGLVPIGWLGVGLEGRSLAPRRLRRLASPNA